MLLIYFFSTRKKQVKTSSFYICWSKQQQSRIEFSNNRCILLNNAKLGLLKGKQTFIFEKLTSLSSNTCCSVLINKLILNIQATNSTICQIFIKGLLI